MNRNQPPRVATWLLRHFGSSPNIEAIVGDLDERYERGRSYFWYWRQALQTILASFFQEVWRHKLLAGRVLLLGWAIKYAWLWSDAYAYWTGNRFLKHLPVLLASVTASVVVCAFSAWFVSRISGIHYRSTVLLYVLIELLAVPVRLIGPATPMIVEYPGEYIPFWASPFATYFNLGLAKLGYPFETVIALWCGCIAMAVTMLLAGRIFNAPAPDSSQGQRRAGVL